MILGVNTSHNASFCLVDDDGKVRWLLEEERFCRIKNAPFTTLDAIEYAVHYQMLTPEAVTTIAYSFEMDEERTAHCERAVRRNVVAAFGEDFAKRFFKRNRWNSPLALNAGCGSRRSFAETRAALEGQFPNAQVESHSHHHCHAASVYYPSGAERAAVLIVDGAGRQETTTLWRGDSHTLTELARIELPHSLGLLYWIISGCILGMEEGQTMGLASYGRPLYRQRILDELIEVEATGLFRLRVPAVTWFDWDAELAIETLEQALRTKRRLAVEPLTQNHADLAASLQSVTELIMTRLARHAMRLADCDVLCLAGGVIQNCSANGEIARSTDVSAMHIQPAAHDAGTALGAALITWTRRHSARSAWRLTHAMHGAPVDMEAERLAQYATALGCEVARTPEPAAIAAELLSAGRTVAWVTGAAEIGPRALGHRSLLAHPGLPFMTWLVNRNKQRQFWRPLAPACLQEEAAELFHARLFSPFMLMRHFARASAKERLPAIVHVDGSSRLQIVREEDREFRALLAQFKLRTGLPALLNTSLNRRGEPIVQRALEALTAAISGGVDDLFVERLHIRLEGKLVHALPPEARFIGLLVERLAGRHFFIAHTEIVEDRFRALVNMLTPFGIPFIKLLPGDLLTATPTGVSMILEPWTEIDRLHALHRSDSRATVLLQETSGYIFEIRVECLLEKIMEAVNILRTCSKGRPLLLCRVTTTSSMLQRILEIALQRPLGLIGVHEIAERIRDKNGKLPFLLLEVGRLDDFSPAQILSAHGLEYEIDWLAIAE